MQVEAAVALLLELQVLVDQVAVVLEAQVVPLQLLEQQTLVVAVVVEALLDHQLLVVHLVVLAAQVLSFFVGHKINTKRLHSCQ
jgi:hypothetical protein